MSTTKVDQHHTTSFERWEKDNILVKGLVSDFEALLDDESTIDLHFLIDQESVPAHRVVVLARCERYRKKKRLNQPSDINTPVTVQLGKHFSASAVRDIVRYLYTGKVSHSYATVSVVCDLAILHTYHSKGALERMIKAEVNKLASLSRYALSDSDLKDASSQLASKQELKVYKASLAAFVYGLNLSGRRLSLLVMLSLAPVSTLLM